MTTLPRVSVVLHDLQAVVEREGDLLALLADDEKTHAGRFRRDVDRRRFVLRRGLRREALARVAGVAPVSLRFGNSDTGKPMLVRASHLPDIRFSSSSAGDSFLLGSVEGVDIGVDIELTSHVADLDGVVDRICTPAETSYLGSLPKGERDDALCRLWVRKEAVLKASGVGLTKAPETVDILLGVAPVEGVEWHIRDLAVPGGMRAALASCGPCCVQAP